MGKSTELQLRGGSTGTYIGEVKAFAFSHLPEGWLKCDGSILLISDYQKLFDVIGTTHGGDGVTTFALPDLRGKFLLGASSRYAPGASGGAESTTLTAGQMPEHVHQFKVRATAGATDLPDSDKVLAKAIDGGGLPCSMFVTNPADTVLHSSTLTTAGSQSPVSVPTMPPYATLLYCIAHMGIYAPPV